MLFTFSGCQMFTFANLCCARSQQTWLWLKLCQLKHCLTEPRNKLVKNALRGPPLSFSLHSLKRYHRLVIALKRWRRVCARSHKMLTENFPPVTLNKVSHHCYQLMMAELQFLLASHSLCLPAQWHWTPRCSFKNSLRGQMEICQDITLFLHVAHFPSPLVHHVQERRMTLINLQLILSSKL